MTGLDKARATASAIKSDIKLEDDAEIFNTPVVQVEHHSELTRHHSMIQGLEEVPTSIIPLPFYKLVQPGSTNIRLEDGTDADTGEFYMGDTGTSANEIKVGIVRVKRMVKEFKGKKSVSLGMLGVNLETMTPFIMNVSSTNFSNFGRFMNVLNQKKIDAVWKYPVKLVSGDEYKVETKKNIDGNMQMVKYWTMDFQLVDEPFNESDLKTMSMVLNEYSGTLDRDIVEED